MPKIPLSLALTVGSLVLGVGYSRAQTPEATPSSQSVDADRADVSITAHVTADELEFSEVPTPRVTFTTQPEAVTIWDATRHNLPRPVQPGVTYRNIGVDLKIVSVFADIDRIVADALGESPADSQAEPASPTASPLPRASATPPER